MSLLIASDKEFSSNIEKKLKTFYLQTDEVRMLFLLKIISFKNLGKKMGN